MAKQLLLISSLKEDIQFAQLLAENAKIELKVVSQAIDAIPIIDQCSPSTILVDTSTQTKYLELENAVQTTLGMFSDKINANSIHFLTHENIENVQYLIQSPLFGHYVMRNFFNLPQAAKRYAMVIRATLNDRAFGIKNLLPANAKIQAIRLQKSTQKQEAVEAIKSYFLAAKFKSRMATIMANAVDELLMNAIFDAPVDETQRPMFTATSRNTLIELTGKHEVEMHVGYDGNTMAICAIDHFGSLQKTKLLSHISKIYRQEEYKVRTTVAGAGIGLATVFRSGGSFLFSSEAGVKTEVTVFFERTDNFRDFKDQFRFISTQFYF